MNINNRIYMTVRTTNWLRTESVWKSCCMKNLHTTTVHDWVDHQNRESTELGINFKH